MDGAPPPPPVPILVLGLGNTLLADDGVGVRVVESLQGRAGATALELLDGGTMGFRLAQRMAEARSCIVVDAARLDAPPGTVRVLCVDELQERFANGVRGSAHEAGLLDLLGLLRLEDQLPERLAIVAVQPRDIRWGETPSPAVAAAVTVAADAVLALANHWESDDRDDAHGRRRRDACRKTETCP